MNRISKLTVNGLLLFLLAVRVTPAGRAIPICTLEPIANMFEEGKIVGDAKQTGCKQESNNIARTVCQSGIFISALAALIKQACHAKERTGGIRLVTFVIC